MLMVRHTLSRVPKVGMPLNLTIMNALLVLDVDDYWLQIQFIIIVCSHTSKEQSISILKQINLATESSSHSWGVQYVTVKVKKFYWVVTTDGTECSMNSLIICWKFNFRWLKTVSWLTW